MIQSWFSIKDPWPVAAWPGIEIWTGIKYNVVDLWDVHTPVFQRIFLAMSQFKAESQTMYPFQIQRYLLAPTLPVQPVFKEVFS